MRSLWNGVFVGTSKSSQVEEIGSSLIVLAETQQKWYQNDRKKRLFLRVLPSHVLEYTHVIR